MKKLLACLTLLFCSWAIPTQAQSRDDVVKRNDTSKLGLCGTSIDRVWDINQQARRALSKLPPKKAESRVVSVLPGLASVLPKATSVFTAQASFPAGQVITCGKFRLYYEDLLQSNQDGFAHPTLGQARRNTLCAVLQYVQSVYNFSQLPANDYIDLYIMWSYAPSTALPTNFAPAGTGFLAQAGPFLSPNFGMPGFAGFYGGYMFDHVNTGADPAVGQYDGFIQVNFDTAYNPYPNAITYWDDYANTASTCAWDLYSILLHEVTHVMGWSSAVKEDASANHYAQNTYNNSFTLIDKFFLYYGDAKTPATFTGNKLVIGSPPAINATVNSNSNPLRSSKVWMNNLGIPRNHPAYSGDFLGYYATPPTPYAEQSLLSHLNDNYNSFTAMTQYSPGFQPNYVMGPGIAQEQFKRQWTNFEMRALLTIGYNLNTVFANSTSLSNGVVTNSNLLNNNVPPHRITPVQITDYAVWNSATVTWGETMAATHTITTNNNTPSNPNATSLIINVSSLGGDANTGDVVKVMPNSLFNIRGGGNNVAGIGGNNHNQLSVNTAGTQVTFKPRPGFRGRAQFGFYLWDGKEKGSFVIATVDVQSVGVAYLNTLPANHNKIMNGDFENGTEVRQRLINEGIEHTGWEFYREGPFLSGDHLSDSQPAYNIQNNLFAYNGGTHIYQAWKECGHVNGGVKGNYGRPWSEFNSNSYFGPFQLAPLGNSATTPNHRYHNLGLDTFLELITPVTLGNQYHFEMDINFERTGIAIGTNLNVILKFVTNPGTTGAATTLQSIPITVPVTTTTHNSWQHVSINVPYCAVSPATFISVYWAPFTSHDKAPLIDNLTLTYIGSNPPLTVSISATPSSATCPACMTLTAGTSGTVSTPTYTWQPGNLSGQTVTVCPTATTNYTVTVSDNCQSGIATTTVAAPGVGSPIWPKHPGGKASEFFTASARASNYDLFAAGHFTDDVAISGFPTWTSSGVPELMVARFSESCGTLWAVQLGNSAGTKVNDMVVDSNDDVFITGSVAMKTKFGSFVVNGPAMYILKLDGNNGNVLAAKGSSLSTSADGVSLSIDPADNVYVGGQYAGSLSFGSLPKMMSSSSLRNDVFAVKYDNSLVPLWSTSFGSTEHDYNGGIAYATSVSGKTWVYVAGNMNQKFFLGNKSFSNATANTTDMFIGVFNSSTGAFIAGRMEGNSTASCNVRDIAADGSGNVYFTGSYKGAFNVAASPLNSTNTDIFIGRWNPALTNAGGWAYSMGGSGVDEGRAISFDGAGNLYFSGNFVGFASFTGFTPSLLTGPPNIRNMFVVKVSPTGARFFAAQSTPGWASSATNYTITTLPSGQSYVGGSFSGSITFGSSATQTSVMTDAIIGRLNNAGSFY